MARKDIQFEVPSLQGSATQTNDVALRFVSDVLTEPQASLRTLIVGLASGVSSARLKLAATQKEIVSYLGRARAGQMETVEDKELDRRCEQYFGVRTAPTVRTSISIAGAALSQRAVHPEYAYVIENVRRKLANLIPKMDGPALIKTYGHGFKDKDGVPEPDTVGYVAPKHQGHVEVEGGKIHISADSLLQMLKNHATINGVIGKATHAFLHEATHKYLLTVDHTYIGPDGSGRTHYYGGKNPTLSRADLSQPGGQQRLNVDIFLKNADSYAHFVNDTKSDPRILAGWLDGARIDALIDRAVQFVNDPIYDRGFDIVHGMKVSVRPAKVHSPA